MAWMQTISNAMFQQARPAQEPDPLKAPNAFFMLLEGRAPWEYAALLAATPWLRRLPRGDGHPVLVFPGLGATDLSTAPLRSFLEDRGYVPYPWKLGFNFGPRNGVLERCEEEAARIAAKHQRPLSLVGWSLGGIYAREVAKLMPDRTRCVITLGTPFTGHPHATNAWRIYELLSKQKMNDEAVLAQVRRAIETRTMSTASNCVLFFSSVN